ncbi:Uncharacterized protein TCM_029238 [Theobroma cacao]|uniref:Uncharacterized protein n=1 Tax=Theobroma cacao TaxID=3641 RepID=A0A061GD97_THECC|nr:Uncharacterized protein TCM_029238 [Theobroma cacao]
MSGSLKFKTDGAARVDLRLAAIGGVLRDKVGTIKVTFSKQWRVTILIEQKFLLLRRLLSFLVLPSGQAHMTLWLRVIRAMLLYEHRIQKKPHKN